MARFEQASKGLTESVFYMAKTQAPGCMKLFQTVDQAVMPV
jgi:hypothetical protein